jgi:hypothetical protein
VTNYYKDLFSAPSGCCCTLDEARVEDIYQVLEEENNVDPFIYGRGSERSGFSNGA